MRDRHGNSTDDPMAQSSDPEKDLVAEKAGVTCNYAGKRKRTRTIASIVIVLLAAALLLDATAIYLVLKIGETAIEMVWQVITSLGFFLYKVYSQFVTPEQWPGK